MLFTPNAIYKIGREFYRLDGTLSLFKNISKPKETISVSQATLLGTVKEVPITDSILINNGFIEEKDESSMSDSTLYRYKEHSWFTLVKDTKGKYHVSVLGGMILGGIANLSDIQRWFDVLSIKKVLNFVF